MERKEKEKKEEEEVLVENQCESGGRVPDRFYKEINKPSVILPFFFSYLQNSYLI